MKLIPFAVAFALCAAYGKMIGDPLTMWGSIVGVAVLGVFAALFIRIGDIK